MEDQFNLERFLTAQSGMYEAALAEIRQGAKRSHWMWYIFPQHVGLGRSATARHFGIRSLDEARSYLTHPLLGPRLRTCLLALQHVGDRNAEQMFGPVDAMKLRSSLTLFIAAGGEPIFQHALDRWFEGKADQRTLELIGQDGL